MPTRSQSRLFNHYRLILVVVLLTAAVLRLYGINNLSPPGLEHDEVAHWLINRDILSGNLALYFTDAYGHEAGFHYIQTAFSIFLGDNAFALRLPSAFAGLMLVSINFALTRRLFGIKTALLSASLVAVLFWPVFYSRLALRAIALPLLASLSAYFWWKAWQDRPSKPEQSSRFATLDSILSSSLTWFAMAGLFAGLTFYTYMASRVLPIFFLLYLTYLAVVHRPALKLRWRGILLFVFIYLIIAAPLGIYLLNNPGIESRIGEVDAPLLALARWELKPVLINGLKIIAMFGLRGDPLWRQNVADLPVFDPIVSLFFYIGLIVSLWRWRQPRYLFLLLWLLTATIPSIVTIDAPSSIRIINALPVITIFPIIGLEVIHIIRSLSTVSVKLSTEIGKKIAFLLIVLFFLFNGLRTAKAIFQTWPNEEEVQFVWQSALTEAAAFLDTSAGSGPVAIGGWTPDSLDAPTMELTLRRRDLSLRFFDPTEAIIIPGQIENNGNPLISRIVHPTALPLQPALEKLMHSWSVPSIATKNIVTYEINQPPVIRPSYPAEVIFGGELTLLGFDVEESPTDSDFMGSEGSLDLITFWRVNEAPAGSRRLFLHLVDGEGSIVAQDDRLGAPARYWVAGDIIIQRLSLGYDGENAGVELRLGVYDPDSGLRMLTDQGEEFVNVGDGLFKP